MTKYGSGYRPAFVTQRDGSSLANSNCRMASIAMGLDYQTAGAETATAAAMRTYTDDQSGGTGSDDARQAWARGWDESLRVMDGYTFADVVDDLRAGRVVHLDVWASSVGEVCLSGSGEYGHTIAVLPDYNADGWAVGDPWCTGGYARVLEADLRRGAEFWGGQVYSLAADEPDYPSGGPGPRDPRVLVIVQRIVRRLMTLYDPSNPAPAPPGRDTGGGAVLYTTTKIQAANGGSDVDFIGSEHYIGDTGEPLRALEMVAGDKWQTFDGEVRGTFSHDATVHIYGRPDAHKDQYAVRINTGILYADGVTRPSLVLVSTSRAPIELPPSGDPDIAERDEQWREWLLAGSPGYEVEADGLRQAASRIATLSEEDVRDYEQGLCFFCRASRGHAPDCSYVALRSLLAG